MEEGVLARIRTSLTAKRDVLRQWAQTAPPQKLDEALGPIGHGALERHLAVIDDALGQAEDRTIGTCTTCNEPVEASLIQMDYTACVCLEHFTEPERRSLEAELELAGAVQRSLLPQRPPDFPGLEIAAFSRPAQIVGGDYFDFFPFAGNRHGIVISDVVGHGLSSSLIMASLQTMLRTLTQEHASPAGLVARINRLCLHNIQFTTFVTLFLGARPRPNGSAHPAPRSGSPRTLCTRIVAFRSTLVTSFSCTRTAPRRPGARGVSCSERGASRPLHKRMHPILHRLSSRQSATGWTASPKPLRRLTT